jgi:hypothetical protein
MPTELERFTDACFVALYFTDAGPDSVIATNHELSEETRLDLMADCRSWWHRFGCFVTIEKCVSYVALPDGSTIEEQAGHDFWLTRNGHGAGFWDGDWPEPYAEMFTEGAKSYGEFQPYLGDDSLIYAYT